MRRLIILFFLLLPLSFFLVSGCSDKLPLNVNIANRDYTFFNQDSSEVHFQKLIKGNITVIGFIYTHCPDICPMTTHNMQLTQERLKDEGIENVNFVSVTFDPNRDFPAVLKKFAEIRDIDFNNWTLLWGDKKNTNSLMQRFDITVIPTDTTYSPDGEMGYSIMHTDRISLLDTEGRLRKNYRGSLVNLDELFNDIKYLGE